MAQPRSIREWLEETADQLVQDASTTPTLPDGVRELKYENDVDPVYIDNGGPFMTAVPGPRWFTFVAVLNNGDTIETVRG